jgi:hypothetical protein
VPANLEPLLRFASQGSETFKSVVTPDFAKASILVRTKLSGSRSIERTLNGVRNYLAEHFPKDLPVRLTWTLVLFAGRRRTSSPARSRASRSRSASSSS